MTANPKARFLLLAIFWGACTADSQPECRSYLDCGSAQTCDTVLGLCVDIRSASTGSGTPARPSIDSISTTTADNSASGRTTYTTTSPVLYLADAPPSLSPDTYVFAERRTTGNTLSSEKIRRLDENVSAISAMPVLVDLEQTQIPLCDTNAIHHLAQTEPNETWISCSQTNATYILYENQERQGQQTLHHRSDFLLHLPTTNADDWDRVAATARGSSSVRLYQLRTGAGDGFEVGHPYTDQIPFQGGPIHGLWVASSAGQAEHVIVLFARGGAAHGTALHVWQRFPHTESWTEFPEPGRFDLPEETFLVYFRETPRLSSSNRVNQETDFLTIDPQSGRVRYWNLNDQREIFPSLQYETDSQYLFPSDDIPTTQVIELAETETRDFVFLAHPDGNRIWRIPTKPEQEDELRTLDVMSNATRISDIVAVNRTEIWVSYRNENRLDRLVFPD